MAASLLFATVTSRARREHGGYGSLRLDARRTPMTKAFLFALGAAALAATPAYSACAALGALDCGANTLGIGSAINGAQGGSAIGVAGASSGANSFGSATLGNTGARTAGGYSGASSTLSGAASSGNAAASNVSQTGTAGAGSATVIGR